MKKAIAILVVIVAFSAFPSVFAGHEIVQGLINSMKQTEQKVCASNGNTWTRYERIDGLTRYSIEMILLPSGDTFYRTGELQHGVLVEEMFVRRAGSHDLSRIFSSKFTEHLPCDETLDNTERNSGQQGTPVGFLIHFQRYAVFPE